MTSLTSLFDAGISRKRAIGQRPISTAHSRRLAESRALAAPAQVSISSTQSAGEATAWRARFESVRVRTLLIEWLAAGLAATVGLLAGLSLSTVLGWALALAIAVPGASAAMGAYRWRTLGEGWIEVRAVLRGSALIAAALVTLGYVGLVAVPPVVVFAALPIATAASVVTRVLTRRGVVARRNAGSAKLRTVVIGSAALSQEVFDKIAQARGSGYEVVGWCSPTAAADAAVPVPFLGSAGAIGSVVAEHEIDVVMLVGPQTGSTARSLSWALAHTRASLVVVPSLAEVSASRVRVRPTGDLWSIELDVAPRRRRILAKDVIDRIVGGLLFLGAGLVLVPAMVAVRLTSPGPALYKQQRVGIDGTPFTMWKIRSMYVDADARRAELLTNSDGNGLLFKMRHDPRVTPVGRILRRLSIDELPQLFNVVRGEMSLVGPRPALAEETSKYVGDERRRLIVKPGLTGLWQVSGRSDLTREQSMQLDLRYVDNWSLSMDAFIMSRTMRAVLGGAGAY